MVLLFIPKPPLTPIFINFRLCTKSDLFAGAYTNRPQEGELYAFLPYVDLPHAALAKTNAIAFISESGERGWINKDDVEANFDQVRWNKEASGFFALFEDIGWEPVEILWKDIDWDKHFFVRNEDETIDLIPEVIFKESGLCDICEWCGHPMISESKVCEACNFKVAIPTIMGDNTTFMLGEEWQ